MHTHTHTGSLSSPCPPPTPTPISLPQQHQGEGGSTWHRLSIGREGERHLAGCLAWGAPPACGPHQTLNSGSSIPSGNQPGERLEADHTLHWEQRLVSLLREPGRPLTSPIGDLRTELLTSIIIHARGPELPQAHTCPARPGLPHC